MPTMVFWLWISLSLAGISSADPAAGTAETWTAVDRILAVVDGDPILLSDLSRALAFDETLARREGESEEEVFRRALEELVKERIRFHAVDRAGAGRVPEAEVAAHAETARSRFPTEEAFQAELARHGMSERELEGLLARRLAIFQYVNDRLRSQVFVDATEIQTYYDTVLRREVETRGGELPPLDSRLRERIRATVTELKLNEEEERWLRELEAKADVVLLWDKPTDTPNWRNSFELSPAPTSPEKLPPG